MFNFQAKCWERGRLRRHILLQQILNWVVWYVPFCCEKSVDFNEENKFSLERYLLEKLANGRAAGNLLLSVVGNFLPFPSSWIWRVGVSLKYAQKLWPSRFFISSYCPVIKKVLLGICLVLKKSWMRHYTRANVQSMIAKLYWPKETDQWERDQTWHWTLLYRFHGFSGCSVVPNRYCTPSPSMKFRNRLSVEIFTRNHVSFLGFRFGDNDSYLIDRFTLNDTTLTKNWIRGKRLSGESTYFSRSEIG